MPASLQVCIPVSFLVCAEDASRELLFPVSCRGQSFFFLFSLNLDTNVGRHARPSVVVSLCFFPAGCVYCPLSLPCEAFAPSEQCSACESAKIQI